MKLKTTTFYFQQPVYKHENTQTMNVHMLHYTSRHIKFTRLNQRDEHKNKIYMTHNNELIKFIFIVYYSLYIIFIFVVSDSNSKQHISHHII